MNLDKELEIARHAASQAGKKILEVYASDEFDVEFKGHNDPVSRADKLSNIEICKIIGQEFPEHGILTEEKLNSEDISNHESIKQSLDRWKERQYAWMIDPLDGTKDFINKTGEFGIHIGLTYEGTPVLGVNYYPTTETFYSAIKGEGAYRNSRRIFVRESLDIKDMVAVTSRTSTDKVLTKMIEELEMDEPIMVGSMGLKICKVAEGSADLYALFNSKSSLWDSCSSQVIIEEAGGKITDLNSSMIDYRPEGSLRLKDGVLATNGIMHQKMVDIIRHYA